MRGLGRRFFLGAWASLLPCMAVASATAGLVPDGLYHEAARKGSVRVIVQLGAKAIPEGQLKSAEAVASQRRAIAVRRSRLMAELAISRHRIIREFETIPFVALEVWTDAMSLLDTSTHVVGVEEDRIERASLSQSVPWWEPIRPGRPALMARESWWRSSIPALTGNIPSLPGR